MSNVESLISVLGLEPHIEGGFFKRTFQSDHRAKLNVDGQSRFQMTSIMYLLTTESPIGHWHKNESDILHYFHQGDPIEYSLIYPNGRLQQIVMGADIAAGHQLQLSVVGGVWKASRLLSDVHGFGLISEAVSPGWDAEDMALGTENLLVDLFPQHKEIIRAYVKS